MEIIEQAQELILTYGLNILGAAVIVIIGYWLAGIASRWARNALSKTNTNEALLRFLSNLIYYAILAFAVVAALERVGVQTASFHRSGAAGRIGQLRLWGHYFVVQTV